LSGIAGQIAVSGAAAVGATNPNAAPNADLQVFADLAQIDMYLNIGTAVYLQAAAALANDILAQYSSCDSTTQAFINQFTSFFTMSGNTVTGFVPSSQGGALYEIGNWWQSGASNINNGTPGLQTVMGYLSTLIGGGNSQLQPSVNPNAYTPAVFVNLCLIYADAMQYSNINKNDMLDSQFWGNTGPQGQTFAQLFPFALAAYEYQMQFNDPNGQQSWTIVNTNLNLILSALPSASFATNYNSAYTTLQGLVPMSSTSFTSPAWAEYAGFFTNPSDLSNFYGYMDGLYDEYMDVQP
jgi:hypothetical protein